MFGSIRVGSVLGIQVRAHFLLLLLFGAVLVLNLQDGLGALLFAGMWFLLVLLHELGHCVVARHFGIGVIDITLWPLGGIARMNALPESSRIEGLVAIAGPAVNFAFALVGWPVYLWLQQRYPIGGEELPWGRGLDAGYSASFLAIWWQRINLAMGLFNLIPLFPTDGGRLLRAWFGRSGDWVGATEAAVGVGRFFSLALGVTGLIGIPDLVPRNYLLTLIAIYLWWVGTQELMMVRLRHAKGPFRAFSELLRRARAAERAAARSLAEERRPEVREEAHGARGFSDEEIERLERWRGSIRRGEPPE